jgi:UDPglucose 6-dehydrogenase
VRRAPLRPPVIGIYGLGYMGLATGLAFATRGFPVAGYDIKAEVRSSVSSGESPYREAGLPELLRKQARSGRFSVAAEPEELVGVAQGIFLCLPTPSLSSGRIDLRALKAGTREIGKALRSVNEYRVVIVKSTVVPGTTETIVEPLLRRLSTKAARELGVASNPEFLAEGTMVRDATYPTRIVAGTRDLRARAWLRRVYAPFHAPVYFLTPSGAELVKYASNAFLALKVSFANEASRMAEKLGLDIDKVMQAVGADPRIGRRFLRAGPGFGGSCFEKDLEALIVRARELGVRFRSGETALAINRDQAEHVMSLVQSAAGPLDGKTVAVLGVAFKEGTDDVRESRAFPLVEGLLRSGARVRVHDPFALEHFRTEWERRHEDGSGPVQFSRSVLESLTGADVAVLQTDWPEYRRWRPEWTRRMREPLLVDLRRSIDARTGGRSGLRIVSLGVGSVAAESPETAGGFGAAKGRQLR